MVILTSSTTNLLKTYYYSSYPAIIIINIYCIIITVSNKETWTIKFKIAPKNIYFIFL